MSGDREALIVATLICVGCFVWGIVTGSPSIVAVGFLGAIVGGVVLKVLG